MDQEKLLTYCKEDSENHIKDFAYKCIEYAAAEFPYPFARDPKWEGRNRIGANGHCYDGELYSIKLGSNSPFLKVKNVVK